MSSISACRTRESIPSKRAMQESPVPKQRPTVMSSALPIFVMTSSAVADEIIIRRAVHICHTCRSKSNHQTNYNTTTLTHCVRKLEMNHFCQLCGHHIGLLGLMSLDSVKKSMEALLRLFYEKVVTPDMI